MPFDKKFVVVCAVARSQDGRTYLIDPTKQKAIQACQRPYDEAFGSPEDAVKSPWILSDCHSTAGSTGSVGLSRLDDTQHTLSLKSFLLSGVVPRYRSVPFSIVDDIYAVHITITKEIAEQMASFDAR